MNYDSAAKTTLKQEQYIGHSYDHFQALSLIKLILSQYRY